MHKVWNIKMEHFIGSLGFVDNTRQIHWVPRRLFVISDDLYYPEHSHPVLDGDFKKENFEEEGFCSDVIIYHLGHLGIEYMDYILKRYKQHANDSVIHNQEFLKQWKLSHLLGQYPNRPINPLELPKQICNRYEINKDEFYFANRLLEAKHSIMVKQWYDYFKPKSVLDLGCGKGNYLYYWTWFVKDCCGIEKSKIAYEYSMCKDITINEDILNIKLKKKYDLVIAFDLLEHIDYKDIDKAVKIIKTHCKKNVLVSVPYLGDPNLEADPTHIIKEDKEWWVKLFKKHKLKIMEVPETFLYKEQMMILKNGK